MSAFAPCYRYPEFAMPDGSSRTTFATSSGEKVNYPSCIRDSVVVLSEEFDRVVTVMSHLLEELTSLETLQWKASPKDSISRNFTDLEKKVKGIHTVHTLVDPTYSIYPRYLEILNKFQIAMRRGFSQEYLKKIR